MAPSKSVKNRFPGLRGACAAAGLGILALLLLPRSCGEGLMTRQGEGPGSGDVAAAARRVGTAAAEPDPAPGSETGRPEPFAIPAADQAPAREPGRGPGARTTERPGPERAGDSGSRKTVSPEPGTRPARQGRPGSRGGVRAARRSFSFSTPGGGSGGGWAEDHRFIRQGEFAVLLLEAMKIPRPDSGWEPQVATCTLSAYIECGGQPIVALRRQSPLADEVGAGSAFRSAAGDWIGERPIMPSAGWRNQEFLTEGEMVEVLEQLGIRMHTAHPEKLVSWKLARRVLGKFQGLLAPSGTLIEERIGAHRIKPPRGNPKSRVAMSASIP